MLQLHINSRDATHIFSDNDRLFDLPAPIVFNKMKSPLIELTSCEIPYSWYTVDSTNNLFSITVDTSTYNITLTSGNYDTDQLSALLNTYFTDHSVPVTCSYSSTTNKMTFTSVGHTLTFESSSTAGDLYGFSGEVTGVNTLTSDICCDVQRVEKLVIASSFPTLNISTNQQQHGGILATFMPNNTFFGTCTYDGRGYKFESNITSIDQFRITILNEQFQNINLNSVAWTMTITLYY